MDDKENRAPPLSLEAKRERMLQRLQRRNSATVSKDFSASVASSAVSSAVSLVASSAASSAACSVVSKADESETIETKALVAWMNAVLAPVCDDVDAGGRSELETLLDKDNCGKQLKEMLGRSADASKRESSAGGRRGKSSQTKSKGDGSGGMLQYFMKGASHANLSKRLAKDVSEEVLGAIQCLVVRGKIGVRKEIKVHTNLGVQAALCQALLSFQPVWLRAALEYVCDEPIQLPRVDGRVRYVAGMSAYIQHHLLADYSIVENNRKLCQGNKRLLTEAGIDAIQKNFLAKFLCILYLIEWMLTHQLLPDVPCMFWPSSKLKSINDVLALLSRELLSGGSSVKALQQAGFNVSYQQGFFEEYKYVVKNFQTDLGDGIVLAKLVEVLAAKRGKPVLLIDRLRNPAGDRLRKVTNVRTVLDECADKFPEQFGVGQQTAKFKADDVVAGKRDTLVELVWRLIGVVLGDEVMELRREFVAKYCAVAVKPQSMNNSDRHGLDLPLLVEMRRLNAIAGRIQVWWRRRRIIRATLARAREAKPVTVIAEVAPSIQPPTETVTEVVVELPQPTEDFDEKTLCDETEEKQQIDEEDEVDHPADVALDASLMDTSASNSDVSVASDGADVSVASEGVVYILQSTTVTIQSHCRTPSAASIDEPEDEEAYATANESYGSVALRNLSLGSSASRRLSNASFADHDLSVVNDRSVGGELTFLPDTIESVANDFEEEVVEAITVTMATSPVKAAEAEMVEDAKADAPTSSAAAARGPKPATKNDGNELSAMLDKALNITENTLVARQIAAVGLFGYSRPRAQSDGAASFTTLTYEEFRRNLDKRRREMRLVGIPMRVDPLKALKEESKAGCSQPKAGASQSKTSVQSLKAGASQSKTSVQSLKAGASQSKTNIPRPKPTGSHQKQQPKFK